MTSTEPLDGVTKFESDHRVGVLAVDRFGKLFAELQAWRQILFQLNLIGQDPSRYDGAGYGNVSARVPPYGLGRGARAFLITGTQTGGRSQLSLSDYCIVERYDIAANRVASRGQTYPSSESMSHGALYDANAGIRFVFHGHIPVIWRNAKALGLPCTHPETAYGTAEMAREVASLYRSSTLHEKRVLAMLGHEDGIVSFGRTAEEAGQALVNTLADALAREQCQNIPELGCRFD